VAYLARAVAQVDRTRAEALAAKAKVLARSITDPAGRVDALADLVPVLAGADDHDRAEAVIRCIIDPDSKANAMIDLARVAPSRTRVLLAQALQLGDWTKPLALLSQVEPAAVIAAADEFLTRDARG